MKMVPSRNEDHAVLKYWCKKLGVSFEQLIAMWVDKVKQRKHIAWYDSLPDPNEIKYKPLTGTKIQSFYKNQRCT